MLEGLNERQLIAASHVDGPMLVNAGPGSGKTKLVTNRISYLVNTLNHPPSEILALTFTNAAAEEMKARVYQVGGDRCYGVVVGTFHSIFLRYILKPYEKHEFFKSAGYPEGFVTLDDDDKDKLIDEAISRLPTPLQSLLDVMGIKRKQVDAFMSFKRAQGWTASDVARQLISTNDNLKDLFNDVTSMAASLSPESEDEHARDDIINIFKENPFLKDALIVKTWATYDAACQEVNGIDFDQMLILSDRLLKADPKVAKSLGYRFKHIMLDEFQDTCPVQFSIIKQIASRQPKPFNLMGVGDGRQSIYAFRAADLTIMTGFPQMFDNCPVVDLEENYRSSAGIISAANKFAIQMPGQISDGQLLAKGAFSHIEDKPELHHFMSDKTEAAWISGKVTELIKSGVSPSEIYVLYRNKALFREVESVFAGMGIDYQIIGNISFWESKEVKDVVAILRVFARRQDTLALTRLIDSGASGITGATFKKHMQANRMTAWEALDSKVNPVPKSPKAQQTNTFIHDLKEAKSRSQKACDWKSWAKEWSYDVFIEEKIPVDEAASSVDKIIETMTEDDRQLYLEVFVDPQNGYKTKYKELPIASEIRSLWHKHFASVLREQDQKVWAKKGLSEEQQIEAWNRRQNNVNTAIDFIIRTIESGVLLEDAVNEITLRTENAQQSSAECVQFMTMHAAKGLEAKHVFLLGVEQENFIKSDDATDENIDEEGRILYVGLTRGKIQSYLTTAAKRMLNGKFVQPTELDFLDVIKPCLKEFYHDDLAPVSKEDAQSNTMNSDELFNQLRDMISHEQRVDARSKVPSKSSMPVATDVAVQPSERPLTRPRSSGRFRL
ncbi:ATP-dependent helicase [Aeromonas dhakensis]|uniref:ATP-dependent helicase n=1 Tax=Aeromonas dhakensis TaxID=196024 RepID=UPI00398610DB